MATMPHSIRIPEALWRDALTKARAEETTVTAVVVEALKKYLDTAS